MKKLIFILCAAFAMVACNREQGGATNTGETPGTGSSSSNMTNAPSEAPSGNLNAPSGTATNQNPTGGSSSAGGTSSGGASSENNNQQGNTPK